MKKHLIIFKKAQREQNIAQGRAFIASNLFYSGTPSFVFRLIYLFRLQMSHAAKRARFFISIPFLRSDTDFRLRHCFRLYAMRDTTKCSALDDFKLGAEATTPRMTPPHIFI